MKTSDQVGVVVPCIQEVPALNFGQFTSYSV